MWIVTDHGFVSVVQHQDDPSILQVRARLRADILSHFPDAEIQEIKGADYLFRANVPRVEVAQVLAQAVLDLDYESHFKDVALKRSPKNAERRTAYYGTWTAMSRMQPVPPYFHKPLKPTAWDKAVSSPALPYDNDDMDWSSEAGRWEYRDPTERWEYPNLEPTAASLAAVGVVQPPKKQRKRKKR